MALARDYMGSVQPCDFTTSVSGDQSSPETYVFEDGDRVPDKTSFIAKSFTTSNSPPNSGPSSTVSSTGFVLTPVADHLEPEEALINFRTGYDSFLVGNGSLLSFEQSGERGGHTKTSSEYSAWEGHEFNQGYNNNWNQINSKSSSDLRLVEDFNCFETAGNLYSEGKELGHGDHWLYSEPTIVTTDHSFQESASPEAAGCLKRPHMGDNMQTLKKQCSSSSIVSRKAKPKSSPSKDPQSIAAKNRRERISERLKILQELVPNGSKVDLVTMLEKAISYVKFLQLQVKVLATDEFWPVQGGKAPDISQVKEAIDAILSSQRDRNSSSK